MELDFLLIDVFTDRPFGGSRLNLFTTGADVPPALMQRLAMEMGSGETAFVMPPRREGPARAGLRVFTPAAEIPFGGHSVLGATHAMDELGRRGDEANATFVWELEAGEYAVTIREDDGLRSYSLAQDPPVFMGQYYHRGKVAAALGLDEESLAITGLPCEVISTGLPIHIVPLDSLDAMRSINLRRREADAIARDLGFGDLFVFTCETEDPEAMVHCRMFAPHFGIPEDAASGAATGALVAYLLKHRLVKPTPRLRVVSEQGLELGRPSRIIAEADVVDGRARTIAVGGQCVLVGSGRMHLP